MAICSTSGATTAADAALELLGQHTIIVKNNKNMTLSCLQVVGPQHIILFPTQLHSMFFFSACSGWCCIFQAWIVAAQVLFHAWVASKAIYI